MRAAIEAPRATSLVIALAVLAAMVAALCAAGPLAAAEYPERPVRIVVPFAPGGGTDLVMRAVAESVGTAWRTPVLIENRPGAGTTLGAHAVAAAPADGYALFANTASFLITPRLMATPPYDAAADFVPILRVASSPHVLVVAEGVPAGTLAAFVAWAKDRPQPATFASFGTGSSSHLGFEILRGRLGLAMVHVPYRGAAPAIVDLLGGRVDAMLADLSTVAEHVKAGRVRALAVTGDGRSAALPDVPSIDEAGVPGFRSESWFGLVAHAGTPPAVVARWERAVAEALARPEVAARLDAAGISASPLPGADFGRFMASEDAKYREAIRGSGATLE